MNRTEEIDWAAPRTLRELGELNARIIEQADYSSDIDPVERWSLVPMLAALNRAGFITIDSQLGKPLGSDGIEQRASVAFFATWPWRGLNYRAADAGLIFVEHKARNRPRWRDRPESAVPVTRCGRSVIDSFGVQQSRRSIRDTWSCCHPDAVEQLLGAAQYTVVDPEWGSSNRLWSALGAALLSPAGAW